MTPTAEVLARHPDGAPPLAEWLAACEVEAAQIAAALDGFTDARIADALRRRGWQVTPPDEGGADVGAFMGAALAAARP